MPTYDELARILGIELSLLLYEVPTERDLLEHFRLAQVFVERNRGEVDVLLEKMQKHSLETGFPPNWDIALDPLRASLREEVGGDKKYRVDIPPPY